LRAGPKMSQRGRNGAVRNSNKRRRKRFMVDAERRGRVADAATFHDFDAFTGPIFGISAVGWLVGAAASA
jgi:hypothetical protein